MGSALSPEEKTTASTRPPLQVTRNGVRPACETNVATQSPSWKTEA